MGELPLVSHGTNLRKESIFGIFMRISSLMMQVEDEASFMKLALADIGQTLAVSRVYTFTLKGTVWCNNYEWVAPGISAEMQNLQHIDMSAMAQESLLPQLSKGKTFVVQDTTTLKDTELRETLLKQGIVAMVSFPLFYKGNVVGFFGFDQCGHVPHWTKTTLDAVVALGSFMNAANAYFMGKFMLQQKRRQLQALFDAMPMPIYVSDCDDYSILFCNKLIHDNFDTSDMQRQTCHKVFQNLDEPCPFCTNHLLSPGAAPHVWHHHNEHINGDFKVVDSLVTWEEKENVRFSIALDITESLRLQREKVLAREAHAAKGHFIANMSHELRTPLNGIIGLTHLASKQNTDPLVEDYLRKITFSSNNLLGVINETLDLSEIEEDKITLESQPFSMKEVLLGAQALLQTEVDRKGIGLEVILDETLPQVLVGDSLRISQIVLNLSSNAVKFTTEGKVTLALHACAPPEGLGELTRVQWVRLDVADTGIGISQEQQEKLFKEFSQVDSSTSRQYGGTGLGLVITQKFVELMGGEIFVTSVAGEGTTFSCVFPLVLCADQGCDAGKKSSEQQDFDISGAKVLLVEDNEINTLIAHEVLAAYGCHVQSVVNGREALDVLEKNTYDIILMDIQMPVMDGLQATKRIREQRRFDHIPIVAMSAHAMVQDYEKSREVGMQAHIPKPFVPEELRATIHGFIRQGFCFSPSSQ